MKLHTIKCILIPWMFLALPVLSIAAKEDVDSVRENIEKSSNNLSKDPTKALYYADLALTEATAIRDRALIAEAQSKIASAYINIGDYVTSYEYLVEAESNCPENRKALLADIYLGMSYSFQKVKDFDNAFLYLGKAEAIYRKLKDSVSLARCANNMGLIYISIPDNNMAEKYFNESLRLNRAIGNQIGVAQNLNNLSFIDTDPEKTIDDLEEAISINEAFNRTWVLGENYNNLGFQFYKLGDYEKALSALVKARTFADMTNAQELIMDNYRYRSMIFADMKDFKHAYSDIKALLERTEHTDMSGGVKEIQVRLMEKNIKTVEREKEQSEREYKIKRMANGVLLLFLAAVSAIIFVIFRISRHENIQKMDMLESQKRLVTQEKILMRKELDYNKKELDNFALHVKSRNEILVTIQDRIRQMYGLPPNDITHELKKLNASIGQFNRTNDDANAMIDKVNSDFIKKLSESYPDLSNTDRRLASLLRIGMSSKEISLILSMEPKSVDMARYRLRKKLNLSGNQNLCELLNNI